MGDLLSTSRFFSLKNKEVKVLFSGGEIPEIEVEGINEEFLQLADEIYLNSEWVFEITCKLNVRENWKSYGLELDLARFPVDKPTQYIPFKVLDDQWESFKKDLLFAKTIK